MRVLWLSVTPSLFDEQKIGGWIASLERIVDDYLSKEIMLGVAFEYHSPEFKIQKKGTIYYPISPKYGMIDGIKNKYDADNRWKCIRPSLLRIVEDFQPDIIHCFGTEWTYGAIAKDVQIPVVIHMQGFLNIYLPSALMSLSYEEKIFNNHFNPITIAKFFISKKRIPSEMRFEQSIMSSNKYFMGRTDWDKEIVKYFSPGSRYYHCEEAIRPEIYYATEKWKFNEDAKKCFITITQANDLKGNEIILRTAKVLKELLGLNFEWRVAGRRESIYQYEKKTGIRHDDVNINLLGMISPDEIVQELANAHLYIHPAIIDNSPNSLCEAQLIGCPVIAANVGGIPQLVEDEKTGILYPYNDYHMLAFKIADVLDNPELLKRISSEEIKVSKIRHSPEQIASRLIEIYKDVIDKDQQISKGQDYEGNKPCRNTANFARYTLRNRQGL